MKKLILALFISGNLFSQNWNVFNKNYRYNYKYNFSQLVTNVMFADTVRQSGTDTTYALNRIGVECTGSCPTITTALNPTVTYIVPNMPQFFQRSICKYSNGLVKLYDTTKIVIVPSCTLNQSWLFDSIYNKTAVCTNISTLTVFGITDSVRTIMINNVDSLQLSKSFGILLFPDPYGKNKYYRLAGIENKNSYDQSSLHGEKVPNAWDFYNYQVGDTICSISDYLYVAPPGFHSGCSSSREIITGKSTFSNSYVYNAASEGFYRNIESQFFIEACGGPPETFTFTSGTVNLTVTALNSTTMECNYLYPAMIYSLGGGQNYANIVKLGADNYGNRYKYYGHISNQNIPNPNFSGTSCYSLNNDGIYEPNFSSTVMAAYAMGFGQIFSDYEVFESSSGSSVTRFQRNGISYFGTSCPTAPTQTMGIIPNSLNNVQPFFYPNPASSSITVPVPQKNRVEISNALGQTIFTSETEGDQKIDISSFPNGIYFVTLKSSGYSVRQKLMISH